MTQRFKDHWYIAVALVAIFAAGNGFGYVFGSKSAKAKPDQTHSVEVAQWAEVTLSKLDSSLELNAEQVEEIRPQIEVAAEKVIAAREQTLLEYHLLLLGLHDQIANQLDSSQQEILKRSKTELEATIQQRFSSILNGDI